MGEFALRFEDVTKRYRGVPGYRSLRQELSARRRNGATARPAARDALSHVSFEVGEGEAVGVIGPNGAGKSTALRIAARVTAPSEGRVRVRGRVGALIEVGAGIHPELTGRENVWLYGAILGLTRREIAARFDSIVEFAELQAHLDTPVKHYSSGMQLRLGFSVAAGIEPDVLVVDEALAVGDARFQVRCLERMAALVRSGTSIVYVSHDLASVESVCDRAVLLVDGRIAHEGPAADTVAAYLAWVDAADGAADTGDATGALTAPDGTPCGVFATGAPMVVRVPVPAPARPGDTVGVSIVVRDGHAWNLVGAVGHVSPPAGGGVAACHVDAVPLEPGVYQVWTSIDGGGADGSWRRLATFRVAADGAAPRPPWLPAVAFAHRWTVEDASP